MYEILRAIGRGEPPAAGDELAGHPHLVRWLKKRRYTDEMIARMLLGELDFARFMADPEGGGELDAQQQISRMISHLLATPARTTTQSQLLLELQWLAHQDDPEARRLTYDKIRGNPKFRPIIDKLIGAFDRAWRTKERVRVGDTTLVIGELAYWEDRAKRLAEELGDRFLEADDWKYRRAKVRDLLRNVRAAASADGNRFADFEEIGGGSGRGFHATEAPPRGMRLQRAAHREGRRAE